MNVTSFQKQLTHGFLPSTIDIDLLQSFVPALDSIITSSPGTTYFSELHISLPGLTQLISKELLSFTSKILHGSSLKLCNIELHFLPPNSAPIPPHQDNFYHCIASGHGVKLLIPLTNLSSFNGGLSFLDCDSSIGVLPHQPSSIRNFSSYILPSIFDKLDITRSSYEYRPGDCSYHLLNSVHYSTGNKSDKISYFLVFRFQDLNAVQCPDLLSAYSSCVDMHKLKIKNALE